MIRWRRGTGGLGLRLTVIMGAVLTPLAVLSYAQTLFGLSAPCRGRGGQ